MNLRSSLSARHWPAIGRYSNAIVGTVIVAAGVLLLVALWQRWIDILPYTSQVASQEPACFTIDEWKRKRLIGVGADYIVPNFNGTDRLMRTLFEA